MIASPRQDVRQDGAESPDGSPQKAAGAAALSAGDLSELLSAFNDATARLQVSHEALRSEVARLQLELSSANEQIERSRRLAALGEMAAGIAHEVRNPLGSIKLYARMLEQDLSDRAPERGLASKIAAAVRGLDAIVGDVLSFAGELRSRPEDVSTRELIERSIAECADGVCPAGVLLEVQDGAHALHCDATLANRAIVNILRNAIDAVRDVRAGDGPQHHGAEHDAGGAARARIIVRASRPRAGRRGERCVIIGVRDFGPGVPDDVLPRIFNPFFTTRATGTGLGLAIVHRIMEAHAGRVAVSNVRDPASGRIAGALVELVFPDGPAGGAGGSAGAGARARRREPGIPGQCRQDRREIVEDVR